MSDDKTNSTDHPEAPEAQAPEGPEDYAGVPHQGTGPRWAGPYEEEAAGADHGVDVRTDAEEAGRAAGSTGAVAARSRDSGLLGAETFTLSAVFLLAVTVFSSQIVQLFGTVLQIGGQPIQHEQVAQLSNQVLVGGGMALLTVLLAAIALVLADAGTRSWARWGAAASMLVGLLFLIISVLTYVMVPAGTDPQMPEMPAVPE